MMMDLIGKGAGMLARVFWGDHGMARKSTDEEWAQKLVEVEVYRDILQRDLMHQIDVLTPIFQAGKRHEEFGRPGEWLVDAVPRMVEAYESLRAELATVKAERDAERDRANRFDLCAQGLSEIIDDQKADKDRLYRKLEAVNQQLANVKAERDNYKSMLDEEIACGDEYLARAEALGCPKDGNISDAYTWALAELAAMRQPVPVKVRWNVTAEEACAELRKKVLFDLGGFCAQKFMDILAAHAVIDAPAGVPSVAPTLPTCACDDALNQSCPKCHPLGDGKDGYYPNDHKWDGPCHCSHCTSAPTDAG